MRNCHHFPLSLQFLYYSLSDLHNRTHLNRTVYHALERNLQNLINKDKIRLAEKLFHHLAKAAYYERIFNLFHNFEILEVKHLFFTLLSELARKAGKQGITELFHLGIKSFLDDDRRKSF